ncbi:hypothetical protein L596_023046 [Steinernema carpocapsae]|uniref:Phosphatidylethanolamine-binding protein n=1 Tax=Steinernema carpocapsae TaxID=34508 RepID=A0A4U5MCH2_STECR|nr:hypothetical protein L596_023046 [Steinernema carpocapsae]
MICLYFIFVLACLQLSEASEVSDAFENYHIAPDVIDVAPQNFLEVKYTPGKDFEMELGTKVIPSTVQSVPWVTWDMDPNTLYTLVMIDPDTPSPTKPVTREWRHWLVTNIPEDNVKGGEIITNYAGPTPPPGDGFHRYVFLVYKQPGEIDAGDVKSADRGSFKVADFAREYRLGDPVAGNFFQA